MIPVTRSILATAIALSATPLAAMPPLSFDWREVPLTEVVKAVAGDLLARPYRIEAPLDGTVTLATHVRTAEDAVVLLDAVLQWNGAALELDGEVLVVRPCEQVARCATAKREGEAMARQARRERLVPLAATDR